MVYGQELTTPMACKPKATRLAGKDRWRKGTLTVLDGNGIPGLKLVCSKRRNQIVEAF